MTGGLADEAWRGPVGVNSKVLKAIQQDECAGGHERRLVTDAGGRQWAASIVLQPGPYGGVYARLYANKLPHRQVFVCRVDEPTREANLRAAWRVVHARGLRSYLEGEMPKPVAGESLAEDVPTLRADLQQAEADAARAREAVLSIKRRLAVAERAADAVAAMAS